MEKPSQAPKEQFSLSFPIKTPSGSGFLCTDIGSEQQLPISLLFLKGDFYDKYLPLITISDNEQAGIKQFALQSHQC